MDRSRFSGHDGCYTAPESIRKSNLDRFSRFAGCLDGDSLVGQAHDGRCTPGVIGPTRFRADVSRFCLQLRRIFRSNPTACAFPANSIFDASASPTISSLSGSHLIFRRRCGRRCFPGGNDRRLVPISRPRSGAAATEALDEIGGVADPSVGPLERSWARPPPEPLVANAVGKDRPLVP